eukprot:SAG11_NODE_590_length_8314_cov_44.934388_7_plen_158_part_00
MLTLEVPTNTDATIMLHSSGGWTEGRYTRAHRTASAVVQRADEAVTAEGVTTGGGDWLEQQQRAERAFELRGRERRRGFALAALRRDRAPTSCRGLGAAVITWQRHYPDRGSGGVRRGRCDETRAAILVRLACCTGSSYANAVAAPSCRRRHSSGLA